MKKLLIALCLSVTVITSTTSVCFAATANTNSVGSVDSNSLGSDTTQTQTGAYDTVIADKTITSEVYATRASTFELIVPRKIILGSNGVGNYKISLNTAKTDIASDEVITVEPASSFTLTEVVSSGTGRSVPATVAQTVTSWKLANISAVGSGTVSSAISAGRWKGSFKFTVALTHLTS